MRNRRTSAPRLPFFILASMLLPVTSWAQSLNASISGTVKDPSGAIIPGVELTLTNMATGTSAKFVTADDGTYAFRNINAGKYELRASLSGFKEFVQKPVSVLINESVRVDVNLEVGATTETVEVLAGATTLDFETATRQEGISPETIGQLPLIIGGKPRSSASFAVLMPGVNTGSGNDAFNARINGGLKHGDEAIVDGVSMQQGMMSQTGMISINGDFQYSPDMVSEVKVLTSNYEPQYGATTSAVIVTETKQGTNDFHGGVFWYHRNTVLNARQFGADTRPVNLQNNPGAFFGGPAKGIKGLWSDKRKTYFYINFEAFRIAGGATRPTISIPSLKNRQGDFTDWIDPDGKLIPIFDPATTKTVNGEIVRDQFMGCDGKTPNVICPSRIQNSLALQWFKFLPTPTSPGPLTNYLVPKPVPDVLLGQVNNWLVRADHYIGQSDHFSFSVYYQGAAAQFNSQLPPQLAEEDFTAPQYSSIWRLNWDHTFSSTLLNHFAGGYLNRQEGYGSINGEFVNELPKIKGVASNNYPPEVNFSDGFSTFGSASGTNTKNVTGRPSYIVNDLVTWIRGRHTFKFGGEYRHLGENNRTNTNEAGTFSFSRGATGLLGINSGSPIASFLLEAVDSANVDFRTVSSWYPRADAYILHFGHTWKATPKMTINYGIRWDYFTPSVEKFDRTSFFDPLGANPGAGGRPGRLAFAGTEYGSASFGRRHPEESWKKGFAPRLGIAYSVTPKTVVRTGYGIFYAQAYYPGWGGGIDRDGFDVNASFSSTQGGLQPAFILSQGFPQTFQRPPIIDPAARNGRGMNYRPFDANRLPYSQQWNLNIEHQFENNLIASVAYVANKGTRIPSGMLPLNALDPKLLSMGNQLFEEFQPGQTELHGVKVPYVEWQKQLSDAGCAPSLAQALLPYPQYCSPLRGLNENAGNSTYHSFQAKVEKRFTRGVFLLASYTLSKLLTTTDETNQGAGALDWNGSSGVISPFERQRNKALALDDVPNVFSLAFAYDLPVGPGRRFQGGDNLASKIFLEGWQISGTFRASSGLPLFFRSSQCTIPDQFRVGCIPAIKPGANPFAQDKSDFDPNKPLFNKDAFESIDSFNFYYGKGPRITDFRGFGYRNQDFALIKESRIREQMKFQLRAEFFNLWNWHMFNNSGQDWGDGAFTRDLASPNFGKWNGTVSTPRTVQVGVRLVF